ncbi:MAG: anaerobic carbon-monoxide dehydrogenase catalytic subunit [Syntrophobacterales bacterium]|jgi:carbon-monoxide dehydrogenase catalytic subunit|nr:anaerobic carbon-monoxide dehydrogenase catalytic subunit [Syntrophobacterales bacterium]
MDHPASPDKPLSIHPDTLAIVDKARAEGLETVWDRAAAQEPQCGFCELGLSCRICVMGPCRIDPFGDSPQRGICGADAHIMVARNLARMIAAGAASHSDHGRDLVETLLAVSESRAPGYKIADAAKLDRLAAEFGVAAELAPLAKAKELALAMMEEYGIKKGYLTFTRRLPAARLEKWRTLGIEPRGIDWEVTEMMHRTHMGVDNDPVNLLVQALRVALSDGWGGSMIATEVSDILFGTPQPVASQVNLGVLKADQVNIILHGHSPLVSDTVAQAAQDPQLLARARELGAAGLNLVGLCCTGNEVLMRRGIPMAGNHLVQELALVTGAVEAMVVDYQCIMPSLGDLAACYHTKFYSTSPKAKFPGATHLPFSPENAQALGRQLVAQAVEDFARRRPERVLIPVTPVSQISGFSVEVIQTALGGTWDPLLNAIKAGQVRGAVGVVGCNNPKVVHDYGHTTLTRKLIEADILILDTGCAAVAHAKAGFKQLEAAALAGPGLRAVCQALGIPPVLHMGSCVDNTRIINLVAALAQALGVDLDQLPVAAAAPEWYSEKAATIASYAVACGIYTVLGVTPPVLGSSAVTDLLLNGLQGPLGATFAVEPDPAKAADLIINHVEAKRRALGLEAR